MTTHDGIDQSGVLAPACRRALRKTSSVGGKAFVVATILLSLLVATAFSAEVATEPPTVETASWGSDG